MSTKIDRALYGPSWTEIVLGAVLSFVLGVVLAATYLVLKPVEVVRELPKEPEAGVVYYVEGSKDTARGRQWLRKRQMLAEGSSITLSEEELNAAIGTSTENDRSSTGVVFSPGTPNFRIRDGQLQVGVPCTINFFGLNRPLMVFARGDFVERDGVFVLAPDVFYIGSCQIQRLPVVPDLVRRKIVATQGVPDEMIAAWRSLSTVSVEQNTLQLSM